MANYISKARIHVYGTDVTSVEEATVWIERAQSMINRIDDAYGKDIMIDIEFDTPDRGDI